jgi:hypothetical protein
MLRRTVAASIGLVSAEAKTEGTQEAVLASPGRRSTTTRSSGAKEIPAHCSISRESRLVINQRLYSPLFARANAAPTWPQKLPGNGFLSTQFSRDSSHPSFLQKERYAQRDEPVAAAALPDSSG